MEDFRNFQISRKKDNLERLTEIFEMSFRKFSVPFDFEPEFSEILVEWNAPNYSREYFPLGIRRIYARPGQRKFSCPGRESNYINIY